MPGQAYEQTGLDGQTARERTNRAPCEFLMGEGWQRPRNRRSPRSWSGAHRTRIVTP